MLKRKKKIKKKKEEKKALMGFQVSEILSYQVSEFPN